MNHIEARDAINTKRPTCALGSAQTASLINRGGRMRKIAIVLMLALSSAANAGGVEAQVVTTPNDFLVVTTPIRYQVEHAKGAELAPRVSEVSALIKAGSLDEAVVEAKDLVSKYQVLFDRSVKQYTFQSKAEYEDFKAGAAEPFEWIDWGYGECFYMQAFIRSERHDFDGALAILEFAKQQAPLSALIAVELGFTLNQHRRFREALDSYMHAEAVAEKYPFQRPHLAVALRGKGFALIELQRLDEAEVAFKASLEIEPNNKLALNELAYIKRLRGAN